MQKSTENNSGHITELIKQQNFSKQEIDNIIIKYKESNNIYTFRNKYNISFRKFRKLLIHIESLKIAKNLINEEIINFKG